MSVRLRIHVDAAALRDHLRTLRMNQLPAWQRRTTEAVARHAVAATIAYNPVDTARSRSSWDAALRRLGGASPPGWPGPHPDATAMAEGRRLSDVAFTESGHTTDLRVVSRVEYINYLEFGTRRMRPFHMVFHALLETRHRLALLVPPLPQ